MGKGPRSRRVQTKTVRLGGCASATRRCSIAFNIMEELLAQLEIAERERDEAVGELDEHNAQRKVEWLLFCMEVYNQRFYFGDLAEYQV